MILCPFRKKTIYCQHGYDCAWTDATEEEFMFCIGKNCAAYIEHDSETMSCSLCDKDWWKRIE